MGNWSGIMPNSGVASGILDQTKYNLLVDSWVYAFRQAVSASAGALVLESDTYASPAAETLPAVSNFSSGYYTFRLNDSFNGSSPIYITTRCGLGYASSTVSYDKGRFLVGIWVGNTLASGVVSTAGGAKYSYFPRGVDSANALHGWKVEAGWGEGYFWLKNGSTDYAYCADFAVERARTAAGAYAGTGWYHLFNGTAAYGSNVYDNAFYEGGVDLTTGAGYGVGSLSHYWMPAFQVLPTLNAGQIRVFPKPYSLGGAHGQSRAVVSVYSGDVPLNTQFDVDWGDETVTYIRGQQRHSYGMSPCFRWA